ncbi:ATP binding protein [Aureococcus anophagefferens]|nr:ATP binding protein [Aureococcus anophagefferens]
MISVRRSAAPMVAELPQKVRSYAKPSPCGLYYPRPATSDGMKPFVEDREAALQREIEKQAARDAAASWAWP